MLDLHPGLDLNLKSGHPALEFTNTVSDHASDQPREKLFKYEDLLSWAKQVGLLSAGQVDQLTRKAVHHSEEAATVLIKSLELREAIYRMFVAQTKGKRPAEKD